MSGSVKDANIRVTGSIFTAIVEMRQRNPQSGCPGIAQQINLAFGLELDKDTVRRILAAHYRPDPTNRGPSWLTTPGYAIDNLWSIDLFRCESITLKTHWIMVVMDQYAQDYWILRARGSCGQSCPLCPCPIHFQLPVAA